MKKGNSAMLSRYTKKKGIVLITTMLTVVLVVMLVSAVVFSNIGSLKQTSFFYSHEEALMAANSGMQYAVTRLQNDITWRGDSTSNSDPVNGLEISEKDGNVVGMLVSASGSRSFFRIKFNYEDGDNGIDGLNDSKTPILSPYVSVNNLYKSTAAKVYPASSKGVLKSNEYTDEYGTKRTKAETDGGYNLPKSTCCLLVEGFAGPGVRNLSLSQVYSLCFDNGIWTGSGVIKGEIAHRVVEAYVGISSESQLTDAAAAAAGKLNIVANGFSVAGANGASSPTLRSLQDLNIHYNKSLSFPNGQVYAGDGYKGTVEGAANSSGDSVNINYSNDSSKFAALKWDEVPNAEKNGGSVITPGTYVWTKRGGSNVLVRLNKSYSVADYKTIPADVLKDAPVFGGNGNIKVDTKNCTIKIKGSAYVNRDGDTHDFIVRNDGSTGAARPIVAFISDKDDKAPILTSNHGDIYIQGATLGAGSITCTGNISLQGPSILESDPGVGVSVYSQKDVNILPIESATEAVKEERPNQVVNPNTSTSTECGTSYSSTKIYVPKDAAKFAENKSALVNQMVDKLLEVSCNNIVHWFDGNCRENAREVYRDYVNAMVEYKQKSLGTGYSTLESYTADLSKFSPDQAICIRIVFHDASVLQSMKELLDASNFYEQTKDTDSQNLGFDSQSEISDAQKFIPSDLASDNFRDNKASQLSNLMTRYGSLKYSDQDIAGVIYAWHNINVEIGSASTLNLTGAMVAYGQDPSNGKPRSDNGTGKININAANVGLTVDPNYMTALMNTTAGRKLEVSMYSVF